jgi:TP901 family phage tail tape measure protein
MAQKAEIIVTADTKKAEKGVKSLTAVLKKNKTAILAASAAIGVLVNQAAKFERNIANIGTLLDDTAIKQLPKFEKNLKKLSVQFGESTDTLSKGLFDIISASIPAAEALDVLEVSARAAQAGLSDTGTAADAITTVLNSYSLAASEAARVSDILFTIALRGKTTFGQLAPNIGKVAATASVAGLSLEELAAAIATLTRAGISTEETMTAVQGVLQGFLKPTEDSIIAAKELGFELNTTTLRAEGLTGVFEKLKGQSAEVLATLFPNVRALKGVAAALGQAAGFAKDYEAALDSAGATQGAFEKIADTAQTSFNRITSAVKLLAINLGDPLLKPIAKAADALVNLLFGTDFEKQTESIEKIQALLSRAVPGQGGRVIPGVGGALFVEQLEARLTDLMLAAVANANALIAKAGTKPTPPPSDPFRQLRGVGATGAAGRVALLPGQIPITGTQPIGRLPIPKVSGAQLARNAEEANKQLDILNDEMKDLTGNAEAITASFSMDFTTAMRDTFNTVLDGTNDFGRVFNNLWKNILNSMIDDLLQSAGSSLGRGLFGLIGGLIPGGGLLAGAATANVNIAGNLGVNLQQDSFNNFMLNAISTSKPIQDSIAAATLQNRQFG